MLRCGQDGLLIKLSQHGTEAATPEPWGRGRSRPPHAPRGIFLQWHFAMCQPFVLASSSSLVGRAAWTSTYSSVCQSKGPQWEWQPGYGQLDKDKCRDRERGWELREVLWSKTGEIKGRVSSLQGKGWNTR